MRKILGLFFICLAFFGAFFLYSQEQEVPENEIILSELIKEAVDNNLMLEAAVNRTLSVEKIIPQAGALPDPQITLGIMNLPINSFSFNQEPMTGKLISVMQMFPFPGKLSLATDIAEYEFVAVKYRQEEVRNQIVQMVKSAYYGLYAIDRAIETIEKNKTLMEQFIQIVEIKYATGKGLQQDVLRAQVELSKLEDDLIIWQQKRQTNTAKLNALLNRKADSPFGITNRELNLPDTVLPELSQAEIEKRRPLLKAWIENIKKKKTVIELAQRDIWPNITVGASYNQRDDLKSGAKMRDFLSTSVSVNIPLFYKRKQYAKVAEKELELAAAEAEYGNVQNVVFAEIESLKAELKRSRKRVGLYKGGIILQAQQSLDSALSGYQVGKVDFLTLISSWMMLQNYELQYFFSSSNYYKSLASYEFNIGEEIIK